MDDELYGGMQETTATGALDAGLYEGLFVGQSQSGQHDSYLQHKVEELEERLRERLKETQALKAHLRDRDEQLGKVTAERDTLLRNISCLYNTAKEEMARKQAEITDLRAEVSKASLRQRHVSPPQGAHSTALPASSVPPARGGQQQQQRPPSLPPPPPPPAVQHGGIDGVGRKRSRDGSEARSSGGGGGGGDDGGGGELTATGKGDRLNGAANGGDLKRHRYDGASPDGAATAPADHLTRTLSGGGGGPAGVRRTSASGPTAPLDAAGLQNSVDPRPTNGVKDYRCGDAAGDSRRYNSEAGGAAVGRDHGRSGSRYGDGGCNSEHRGSLADSGPGATAGRSAPAAGAAGGGESGEHAGLRRDRPGGVGRGAEVGLSRGRGDRSWDEEQREGRSSRDDYRDVRGPYGSCVRR